VWEEVSLNDLREREGMGWIEGLVVMLILAGDCKQGWHGEFVV